MADVWHEELKHETDLEDEDDFQDAEPFEIEEGKVDATKKAAMASAVVAPQAKLDTMTSQGEEESTCKRHRGKFICLGVTVAALLALGVAGAIFFPRMPTAELFSQSSITLDGLQGGEAKLVIHVTNPNRYAIAYQNLVANIFNSENELVGTITRPERFEVGPRSTGLMSATGTFRNTNLLAIGRMGLECLANDFTTRATIRMATDMRLFKRTQRVRSTSSAVIPCSAQNVGQPAPGATVPGGVRGVPVGPAAPAPPRVGGPAAPAAPAAPAFPAPAAPAPPGAAPTPAQQVGNIINQGIGQVTGGGGGAAPRPVAGPADP